MEFKEMKILEFIEDLSGDKSSPGGGSTAALVSALASSLNDMVYSFTVDKKSFENLTEENKAEMLKLQSDTKAAVPTSRMHIGFCIIRSTFRKLCISFRMIGTYVLRASCSTASSISLFSVSKELMNVTIRSSTIISYTSIIIGMTIGLLFVFFQIKSFIVSRIVILILFQSACLPERHLSRLSVTTFLASSISPSDSLT